MKNVNLKISMGNISFALAAYGFRLYAGSLVHVGSLALAVQ